jgi:hypothetical protein
MKNIRRWLSGFLLDRCDALPPAHLDWAAAMRSEMDVVEEKEKLSWAAGCLRASYSDRLRTPNISAGSVLTALALALLAAGDSFAAALTAAYRLRFTQVAAFLGSFTPGDDYRRLIPLMEGLPLWLHALSVIAAACYLIAILRMFFHGKASYLPVLVAVVLELVADQLARPLVHTIGVAANPHPSMLAILFPVVFPLLIAALLWRREAAAKPI